MKTPLFLVLALAAAPAWAGQSEYSFSDELAQGARPILKVASGLSFNSSKPERDPQALRSILVAVAAAASTGQKPVVLFDLDDTLLDTAERHVRILKELSADGSFGQACPEEAARLASAQPARMRYNPKDNLSFYGVTRAICVSGAEKYWKTRFFDNGYLTEDAANPGAVDFVKAVVAQGGTAVYFTGRWEEMRPGTEASLAKNGFPKPDGASVRLWMKPSKAIKDDDYKAEKIKEAAALGRVVAGFENEPRNVNIFKSAFPDGLMVFLDTKHSGAKDVAGNVVLPVPGIPWVADFRIP